MVKIAKCKTMEIIKLSILIAIFAILTGTLLILSLIRLCLYDNKGSIKYAIGSTICFIIVVFFIIIMSNIN